MKNPQSNTYPYTVSFSTTCWERDWEFLLKGKRLEQMIERNNFPFSSKRIFINNVNNKNLVLKAADKLVNRGIIDEFFLIEDHFNDAVEFFCLDPEGARDGYNYFAGPLVSIYLDKSDYFLYFTGDCIPRKKIDWIPTAVLELQNNKRVKSVSLCWSYGDDSQGLQEAKNESIEENSDYFINHGFSDHLFLIETQTFKMPIYDETSEKSNHFPTYGGRAFEKRVHSWMAVNGYLRATYKHASYLHKNFPRHPLKRSWWLLNNTFFNPS